MKIVKTLAMMVCSALPVVAVAQAPSPAQMQQIQQSLQDPATLQRMMDMAKSQTIDISAHRDRISTNCDENTFLACKAGYTCNTTGSSGASSLATIHGREQGRCRVSMRNNDGSVGNCSYSDATMRQMMGIYRATTITVTEAMQAGQRMMQECEFKDAQGKPFAMPVLNTGGVQ